MEDWNSALEMGCSVDILYLDFQKADMIMVYKIIHGVDGCPFDKFFYLY